MRFLKIYVSILDQSVKAVNYGATASERMCHPLSTTKEHSVYYMGGCGEVDEGGFA